jgi:hypothetical protein
LEFNDSDRWVLFFQSLGLWPPKQKTRPPMSESALVTGNERTVFGRLSAWEILFNQRKPTNPITEDPDVG